MVLTIPLLAGSLTEVKKPQIRLWSESRGSRVVQLKVSIVDSRHFTFDAWIVESGEHVGVHSPHLHRPYFHLQVKKGDATQSLYRELPTGSPLRYYSQVFEQSTRKVFGINAWKVFS